MQVTAAKGLTLRQAMLYYDERSRYGEYIKLEQSQESKSRTLCGIFQIVGTAFEKLKEEMVLNLINKLVLGRLTATGYSGSSGLDEPAQIIAPDRWRTLKVDFGASAATAPGVAISGILVFKRRPQRAFEAEKLGRSGPCPAMV